MAGFLFLSVVLIPLYFHLDFHFHFHHILLKIYIKVPHSSQLLCELRQ
jgi:hypothetical protein